ncbi:hypothetical protein RN001_003351 [Aquatica leii]|uniref:Uncharacterized protein n=1 Tax=Aquatica leii TaxID=1421715 RepID=A0AAN7PEW6_9COLE|nr:hypothetical protein RN001_003351 [Aquatica leii]
MLTSRDKLLKNVEVQRWKIKLLKKYSVEIVWARRIALAQANHNLIKVNCAAGFEKINGRCRKVNGK